MLVGEAPGPHTNPKLPLFPEPTNSAAARLLRYAGIPAVDWMGKLVRVNMCDEAWSARRALAGFMHTLGYLLDETNFVDGHPLRVLLLGAKVARAWGKHGAFGHSMNHYAEAPGVTLQVAWVPHPSGRNLIYNDRRNQLRARNAVLWACGMRDLP